MTLLPAHQHEELRMSSPLLRGTQQFPTADTFDMPSSRQRHEPKRARSHDHSITLHLDRLIIAQLLDLRRPYIIHTLLRVQPHLMHEPISVPLLLSIVLMHHQGEILSPDGSLRRKRTFFHQRQQRTDQGDSIADPLDGEATGSSPSVNVPAAAATSRTERDALLLLRRCNVGRLAEMNESLATLLAYDLPGIPILEHSTCLALLELCRKQPVVWEDQLRLVLRDDRFLTMSGNDACDGEGSDGGEKIRDKLVERAVSFFCQSASDHKESEDDDSDDGDDDDIKHHMSSPLDLPPPSNVKRGRQIPSVIVRQLVTGLSSPTTPAIERVRFSQRFAADMVHTMRTLGTSLLYLALFIILIVWISGESLWSRFATFQGASAPTRPWKTFCVGGSVVNGSCHFETKVIWDAVSGIEAAEYVHAQVVRELWKYAAVTAAGTATDSSPANANSTITAGARASAVMYEGAWLVGALLLRLSPSVGADVRGNDINPSITCNANNVSVALSDPFLARYFDCSSWKTTIIPFNATLEEALKLAKAFIVDDVPNWVVASTMAQFATYNPTNGNIAWVTASMGIPRYGGIAPRVDVQVLDTTLHPLISFCMWSSLALAILDTVIFLSMITHRDGLFRATFNLMLRYALFGFIVAAYAIQQYSNPSLDTLMEMLQNDYVVPNLDYVVNASQQAEMLLGLWVFALIAIVAQLTGYIQGLQQVVKLIGIILPELLGLFFVFGFFYVGFVLTAMISFGSSIDTYANFYTANAALIRYFFVDFDLNSFLGNYPQLGFAFYYVFRCFLLFVVTNFCIVTIIAPIKTVWIEGDLPIIVASVYANSLSGWWRPTVARCERLLVSVVVFIINGTPVLFLPYWLRAKRLIDTLYNTVGTEIPQIRERRMQERIEACHKLLDMRDRVTAQNYESARLQRGLRSQHNKDETMHHNYFFRSDYLSVASSTRAANHPASFALSLLLISAESNISWLRNERLLHLLTVFDEFTTQMENAFKLSDNDSEVVAPLLNSKSLKKRGKNTDYTPPDASSGDSLVDEGDRHQRHDFHFSSYLKRKLQDCDFPSDRLYILFSVTERAALIALYVALLVTIVFADRDSVYFIRNVHSGLRDLPFHENCLTADCSLASTRPMTFMDGLHLLDLRSFVHRRLVHSLFRETAKGGANEEGESLPNLSGESDNITVAWDSHIYRSAPITLRQIRGASLPCVAPTDYIPASNHEAVDNFNKMNAATCSSANVLSTAPMTQPSDSLLSSTAYQWQPTCEQTSQASIHGFYNQHWPCSGYSVQVESPEALQYAVDHWIDGNTRLIVIQMSFAFGGKSFEVNNATRDEISYNMIAEFSHGGSAGRFYVRSNPVGDREVASVNKIAAILMAVDLGLGILAIGIPLVHVYRHARHRLGIKSKFSWRVAVGLVYFILYVIRSALPTAEDNSSVYLDLAGVIIATAWLTVSILFRLLFPVALFWFRRVTMVNEFIALAFIQVLQLLPLFVVLVTAFATAGLVMWGGRLESFATFYESFVTVSQAILGDFELPEMYRINSSYAIIYALLMLIVMVILALNLLLAVIAGCAEEARDASVIMRPIETRAALAKVPVNYGPMFAVMLGKILQKAEKSLKLISAASMMITRQQESQNDDVVSVSSTESEGEGSQLARAPLPQNITSAAGTHQQATFDDILRHQGIFYRIIRWWFSAGPSTKTHQSNVKASHQLISLDTQRAPQPLECLASHLSPLVFNEVVSLLSLATQPATMLPSSVACVLQTYQYFDKNYKGLMFHDKALEKRLARLLPYAGGTIGMGRCDSAADETWQLHRERSPIQPQRGPRAAGFEPQATEVDVEL